METSVHDEPAVAGLQVPLSSRAEHVHQLIDAHADVGRDLLNSRSFTRAGHPAQGQNKRVFG